MSVSHQRGCKDLFVVFSGLPASGKTTPARGLANQIGLPLLDKDDILERLFDEHDKINEELRSRLSRRSDQQLYASAMQSGGAVLVSFWQNPMRSGSSGTPSAWLQSLTGSIIEVHCKCSPEQARQQFTSRARHPGHNDEKRLTTFLPKFDEIARRYPLGIGIQIEVEAQSTNVTQLASRILALTMQSARS